MNNKVYDILKWVALTALPAITVFTGVVLNCLNVENAAIVLTIMEAFDAMLGTLLGVSSTNYRIKLDAMTTSEKIDKLLDEGDEN